MRPAVLALYHRAMREDARALRTYAVRLALVVVILIALTNFHGSAWMRAAPGLEFFTAVLYIDFTFITLTAPAMFAGLITEEKEAGTLGLLKMTGLDPASILLGKAGSRMLGAVFLLLAQVPFTLLAVALGGISTGQISAAYVALGAYLLFLANLALLASVVAPRTRAAEGLTVLALFLFFFIPVILGMFWPGAMGWRNWRNPDPAPAWVVGVVAGLTAASPIGRFQEVLMTGFAEGAVGTQAWIDLGLAAGCFGLAWLFFDRATRNPGEASPGRGWLGRGRGRWRIAGPGRAWASALVWKDFHFLAGGWTGLVVRFLLIGGLVGGMAWFIYEQNSRLDSEVVGATALWISFLVMFFDAMRMTGLMFMEETKWKTLSGLAALPAEAGRIAYAKAAGMSIALLPGAAWFLFGWCLTPQDASEFFGHILGHVGGWYFLLHLPFLVHLTAYLSLHSRRTGIAAGAVSLYLALSFTFLQAEEAGVVILCIFLIIATVFLHVQIGYRLRKAAAE